MNQFTVSLAGIPIGVSVLHASTMRFCRDYITDEAPAFSVTLSQSLIDAERERSYRQDQREGIPRRHYSDAYLEPLALYRAIAGPLLEYDTVIFHGSVLAAEGQAYLFTAPSGTGKTTHAQLWLRNIPNAHVLNGDKPLLRIREGQVLACGTPWQGKENYGRNEILPLKAICILERARENHIEEIGIGDALGVLIQQIHRPDQPDALLKTMNLLGKLGSSLRLYRLGCNMEAEAAWISYRGMSQ